MNQKRLELAGQILLGLLNSRARKNTDGESRSVAELAVDALYMADMLIDAARMADEDKAKGK